MGAQDDHDQRRWKFGSKEVALILAIAMGMFNFGYMMMRLMFDENKKKTFLDALRICYSGYGPGYVGTVSEKSVQILLLLSNCIYAMIAHKHRREGRYCDFFSYSMFDPILHCVPLSSKSRSEFE